LPPDLRFLLDEDLTPGIAEIARGLGLDASSVHEMGATGRTDEEQLLLATSRSRVLVTRNRDDFLALTRVFYATNRTHHGVLIVPRGMPNRKPELIAHALVHWMEGFGEQGPGVGFADFLRLPR
jgi:predicted nuclease of predicted toxin-antitoxin system